MASSEWKQKFVPGKSLNILLEEIDFSLEDYLSKMLTLKSTEKMKVYDYIPLILFFIISVAIGLYLGWKSKQNTKNQYTKGQANDEHLTGGRTLSGIPVALSCTASSMSAITVLGAPVEFYTYGTMYLWNMATYLLIAVVVATLFIPVLYDLNLNNGYQYFTLRFQSNFLEKLASFGFLLCNLLYMGIVTYAPALALSALSDIGVMEAAALTATICTLYTFIGGLKAVIWVDVFQALTIMVGFLCLVFKGIFDFGGVTNVININQAGGRIIFDDFRINPYVRHTFWTIVVSGCFGVWGGIYTNQTMIQRYMACKNQTEAKKSIFYNVITLWIVLLLVCICGMCAYCYVQFCDPFNNNFIVKKDQLIPYISVNVLKNYTGLAGFYATAVYAGTLSSLSGGINSTAAVILKNYIKPCYTSMSAKIEALLSKILVILTGILTLGISYIVPRLGSMVLIATLSSLGLIGGPCMGLFILGFTCPYADKLTGILSFCLGFISSTFIFLSVIFDKPGVYETNPLYKEDCLCQLDLSNMNATDFQNLQNEKSCLQNYTNLDIYNQTAPENQHWLSYIWHISYLNIGFVGFTGVYFTGWILTWVRTTVLGQKIVRAEDKFLIPKFRISTEV